MKIAVCDDDQTITKQLKDMIMELEPHASVSVCHDPESLLHTFLGHDLILLDIDMPNMNGIETGMEIRCRDKQIPIVYITNMSDYRSMAFGVHAFDYIEKPITLQKIKGVLQDIHDYHKQEVQIPVLFFKTKEGILRIAVSELLYFEFLDRHVYLHTVQKTYVLTTSLYKVREAMSAYAFDSPHKSFCISLAHIRLIRGYEIHMTNGDVIPLSQKKASTFKASLNSYLTRCLHEGGSI